MHRSAYRNTVRLWAGCLTLALVQVALAKGPSSQPAATSQPATAEIATTRPASDKPAGQPYSLLTTKQLTGDWGGVRTKLQDMGISFSPMLATGYVQNMAGGVNTDNANDFPGIVQYNLEADFNKMKLIPGASFFFRGIESWNDGIKADTGELWQPAYTWGNSGDHSILVDKWWWRQRFLDDRIEIRLGKLLSQVDLFDVNSYAGNQYTQFANQALTVNPSIPSSKGIGAFVKVWPTDWLYLQAGAMDPDQQLTRTGFDTAFHGTDHFRGYWEGGFTPQWNSPKGKMPGNYRAGFWYDPQSKAVFKKLYEGNIPQPYETGDMGFFANFDQLLWKENADPKDKQGLGVFGRYGYADGDTNKVENFWSLGTQYQGVFPTRDNDVAGFGMAQSIMSKKYHSIGKKLADRETVYEWYYSIQVAPWCAITPSFQVVKDPGGNANARDSIVGMVRFRILF